MAPAIATSLSHEVSARLLSLPHVVQVLVRRESDVCYVWTLVDQFSAEVRDSIHHIEQELVADYRPAKFSFRVLPYQTDVAGSVGTVEMFGKTA
jgi:hypothetical protein